MEQIDWGMTLFLVGAILLVGGGLGWLAWRLFRKGGRGPNPNKTFYGTVLQSRAKLGLPPAPPRAGRVPLQPPPGPAPGAPQPGPYGQPQSPQAPYPSPQQPYPAPPTPYPPSPQAPYPPPQAPYPGQQAPYGAPPAPYPPAPPAAPAYPAGPAYPQPVQAAPLPSQPTPLAPQAMPTKQAPVPGVPQGAFQTMLGRIDKTVWIRGGVKIMMPKRERTLLKFVPIMAVLAVGGGVYLGYRFLFVDNRTQRLAREDHVGARLTGERLVPPPDRPPSFFRNTERPELVDLDRNWDHLNPDFAQAVLRVMKRMEEKGRPFVLLEGFRSAERQNKLSAMGYHVTRAAAFQSQHQFGLAADVAPLKDGRISISERDPWTMEAYQMLGQAAAAEGLVWGGAWTNLKDFGHLEARRSIR